LASFSDKRKGLIANGHRPRICALVLLTMLAVGGSLAGDGRAQGKAQGKGIAYSVELKGGIDRARRHELEQALKDAKDKNARLVILRLDTPGGAIATTREMIGDLLAAPLPVVVYVAPDGARAGSAGVFITMASDVAAMAPQTNIGSASPIFVGPRGPSEMPRILYRKVLNDSAAYVRALAEGHGRNADLAERMVRRATNVTARRARRERLVDLVVGNETELLKRLDGFRVKGRKAQVLRTAGLRVVRANPSNTDEEPDAPGDGSLLLGIGLPGLIAIGLVAPVIVILIGQLFLGRPRRH
jgi:membrane-bound serine protease (ClpP class)